jgi:dolichol-phosphate mannosyltransferase
MTTKSKEISVIVPTYNETENIRPLCERLFKALEGAGLNGELLIMDDESVGSEETVKIVDDLKKKGHPVRIHCRKRSEGRGLSSAVLLGFQMAVHSTLVCMDADLQHEPETVPAVAEPVLSGSAEFVVGSRNVAGGGVGFEWNFIRRIMSWVATLLAWPVAGSTDPMSGFFCTTKAVIARAKDANPIGFKIGLEIMSRSRAHPVKDVAITFQNRVAGESKLSGKMITLYAQQLAQLYWNKYGWFLVVAILAVIFILMYLALTILRLIM